MHEGDSLRIAVLRSDRLLSRYNPLERILCADDFDTGFHGWQTYYPDYDGWEDYPERNPELDPVLSSLGQSQQDANLRVDRRIPTGPRGIVMRSTLTSWDVGTYGTLDGTYALKIPTIAQAGNKGLALKRMTCPFNRKFRVETYFTYKAEPSDFHLGETDIRSFMLCHDVMDLHHIKQQGTDPLRWWPSVRYHNAEEGALVQQWQGNFQGGKGVLDGPWEDLKDGHQELGFNRSPTKYQWHYLRFTFDLATHEYVDFYCFGQEFDVAGRKHIPTPPLVGHRASTDKCAGLVNVAFAIESNSNKRCFLYLDSVVISASEG